jgi:hypothetical protein
MRLKNTLCGATNGKVIYMRLVKKGGVYAVLSHSRCTITPTPAVLSLTQAAQIIVALSALATFIALAKYSQKYVTSHRMASNSEMTEFVQRQLAAYNPHACGDDWLCEITRYKPYKGSAGR